MRRGKNKFGASNVTNPNRKHFTEFNDFPLLINMDTSDLE